MSKSVVINLGTGDLGDGLPRVTAQVWLVEHSRPEQSIGRLPAAPCIVELYRNWRSLYHTLWACMTMPRETNSTFRSTSKPKPIELEIDKDCITNISQASFEQLSQTLQIALNAWLQSECFLPIERHLRSRFNPTDEIRVVFETDDDLLRRLPWQHWAFFKDYPKAEMALSYPEYQFRPAAPSAPHKKARILAVMGNSQGIELTQDSLFLQQLNDAETYFLVNPTRQEFNQQLWSETGWDMLFFAGHSRTEGDTGRIYINDQPEHNSLTIEQFAAAIEGAVNHGLKLAIFNSCDGLGLATALGRLHIPQVIVMREPVANFVAQAFFKYFLIAFAEQHLSLYLSVRQARRQLQGLENEFPGASWLPVLCQNPSVEPPVWQDWSNQMPVRSRGSKRSHWPVLLTSFLGTAAVLGLRHMGGLQSLELQAFDHILRLRPSESPDQRLLIITITEDDLHLPEQANRKGSLSDTALTTILQKLIPLKPRAIGLDVYHDFPFNPTSTSLNTLLKGQSNFFAICKVSDPEANYSEIAPLPNLPSDYQGFSDVITDDDSVLRRHLISMDRLPGAACNTPYALSTQLALHYLKADGISQHYSSEGTFHLGNRPFARLQNHTGGYQQADTAGYQILLNYRFIQGSLSPSPTISLKEILAGRIKAADVRDRIILIGVVAPSSKDALATPYAQKIPGVFLQAQMVSQLLSAVKEGRKPIEPWACPLDIIWIWGWATVGGLLIWYCRSFPQQLGLEIIALGTLGAICFYGSLHSQWVPLVPPLLGFILTSGAVALIVAHQEDPNQITKLGIDHES
jgi:CHASE2 domain-containing sensor protein